ncbi:mycothiol transferase [Brachybacterium sp. AOP25-B2-12]|uniref:mycothiol transferase n=1 Tax=Brachybacterium sp. AOP25-B2-12 TaxID=3457710 RepID=UPI0040345370
MPFLTATVTDENDMLATFASQQIRQLATTLEGLDDQQVRERSTASPTTLAILARHVSMVMSGGIVGGLDPAHVDAGLSDPADHAAGACEAGGVRDSDTAASLIADLRAVAERVEATIRAVDLDRRIPVPDAPWFPDDIDTWPARWVAAHCIEEVARHTGHADIIRECLDGKGAYELNALADGEEWPPAGW